MRSNSCSSGSTGRCRPWPWWGPVRPRHSGRAASSLRDATPSSQEGVVEELPACCRGGCSSPERKAPATSSPASSGRTCSALPHGRAAPDGFRREISSWSRLAPRLAPCGAPASPTPASPSARHLRGGAPGGLAPRRRGGDARPRWARQQRLSLLHRVSLRHVPDRLRARRRLRGHLSRRHQANRAGCRGHRHHPRDRSPGGPSGRARPRQHASVHACRSPPGGRRPGSRHRAEARGAPGGDGRFYVGPDNGLLLVAAEKLGGVPAGGRALRTRSTGSSRCRRPSTGETCSRRRPPTSPPESRSAIWGLRLPWDELVHIDIPRAEVGSSLIARHGSLCGPLRERPAERHQRRLEVSRHRAGHACRDRERLRGPTSPLRPWTFADVRAGEIVLYEDSYQNVALALNGGNAAEMLLARPGRELRVRRTDT